jgi:hypothetical protein
MSVNMIAASLRSGEAANEGRGTSDMDKPFAAGLTPQEHGLIEWYMYLSELDMIIEPLETEPALITMR